MSNLNLKHKRGQILFQMVLQSIIVGYGHEGLLKADQEKMLDSSDPSWKTGNQVKAGCKNG